MKDCKMVSALHVCGIKVDAPRMQIQTEKHAVSMKILDNATIPFIN
jgi:hypothetical protein